MIFKTNIIMLSTNEIMTNPFIVILAIVLCEAGAQTCIKNYNLTKGMIYIVTGIILYSIICFLLNKSYSFEGLAKVNLLWSGLSIVASTLIGVLYFKEVLHVHDYFAIAMISAGMYILKSTE